MSLIQVVVNNAVSRIECQPRSRETDNCEAQATNESSNTTQKESSTSDDNSNPTKSEVPCSPGKRTSGPYEILLQLPNSDLRNLCSLLSHEGFVFLSISKLDIIIYQC